MISSCACHWTGTMADWRLLAGIRCNTGEIIVLTHSAWIDCSGRDVPCVLACEYCNIKHDRQTLARQEVNMTSKLSIHTHHTHPPLSTHTALPFVRLLDRDPNPVGLSSPLLPLLLLLLLPLPLPEVAPPSLRLERRCCCCGCLRQPAGHPPGRNPCAVPSHERTNTALRDTAAIAALPQHDCYLPVVGAVPCSHELSSAFGGAVSHNWLTGYRGPFKFDFAFCVCFAFCSRS